MDVVCTENADNKSLVYSGTKALSQPSTDRGDSQGQETRSFEEAYVEFPSRWDLNATVVESEIERELSDTCQTNAKQMSNNVCHILNAKYEMLKNCQTHDHDLADEKSLKRENAKEQSESVTVPAQYIDVCIRKPELQNKHGTPFQASSKFNCLCSGDSLQVANVLENIRNIQCRNSRAVIVSHSHLRMRREREPSRVSFRMVTKLFKRRQARRAVKLYIEKCVPTSSKLKVMLYRYTRNNFFDQCTRSKFTVFPKKSLKRRNLFVARMRTFKHKKSPLFCIGTEDNIQQKLRQLHIKILYHLTSRVISLSGDVELNPGPSDQSNNPMCSSPANFVPLLETRLSNLDRTAIDVGGGGDCFFRAVSHQLYGNPNNHFYLCSVGVQYLVHNPEQFIESNTELSWQGYLQRMSNQGTWADAIIIQAVANCLNLSIHIIESNPAFSPVTIVEPINARDVSLRIYIGHVDEIHYVSTSEMQERYGSSETNKDKKNQGAQKRTLNLGHVREIKRKSFRKRKAANPELVREINKRSVRKRNADNPELVRETKKQSFKRKKATNPEHIKEINRNSKEKLKTVSSFHTVDVVDETVIQDLPNVTQVAFGSDRLHVQKNKDINATSMINLFHKNIAHGPEYVCTCCDQLWYKSSVVKCDAIKYKVCLQDVVKSCLTGFKSVNDSEWICITCDSNLKKGKLPSCSKANKMGFPDKPEVLNLTSLEERLISPRIPFMQLWELPRGGQLSIHGNIVNVPSDVNSTVHCLPRPLSESQTIPIKLKRRLSYKHHYQFQNIRPKRVLDAAKYLVDTSDLFKGEGIEVQNGWLNDINSTNIEDWQEFVQNPIDEALPKDKTEDACNNKISNTGVDSQDKVIHDTDNWCEVEERPSGVTDTLLQESNIVENADRIISFAPGEGNKPIGIFLDKDSEYLSFPSIFCGKRRPDNNERNVPVTYSTIAKWELRSQDRRAAMSVPNIFYKLKKLQIKQIQDSACISLRKCKTKGKCFTAGDLKSEDYLNKLVHLDEGFRVLKSVRGSPPYFEKCKKDLFAMIRQLGNPTWFCSFSAAETRWTHLLKTLGRIVEKKEYTDDEIQIKGSLSSSWMNS